MNLINHTFTGTPLEEVAKKFEQWRRTRAKRGPIPDELLALVKPLEIQYRRRDITRALGINYSRLWSFNKKSVSQPMTLIECSVPSALPTPEAQCATLTFSCKNGRPVTLRGLRGADIAAAISSLVSG